MPPESPSPKTKKPKKGGLLTDRGISKIESAIAASNAEQNRRVSYSKIADRANIPVDRAISILYGRQPEKLSIIRALFKAFETKLRRSDYQILPIEEGKEASQNASTPSTSPWVGREALATELVQQLQNSCWLLCVTGIGGIGKTAFVEHLMQNPTLQQEFPLGLKIDFQHQRGGIEAIARLVLGEEIAKQELLLGGESNLITAVIAKLQFQPCLLILDSIEVLLDADRNFKDSTLKQLFQGLLALSELRSRLILTTRIQPQLFADFSSTKVAAIALKGLQLATVKQLFTTWGIPLKSLTEENCLEEITEVYEGHPLALKIIAGEIREYPYYGNIRAYWREYGYEYEIDLTEVGREPNTSYLSSRSLSNWVRVSLERACQRLNSIYPLAYELLCLGAANQRAVDPQGWGFLIGNFSLNEQKLALDTLNRRLFLEEEKNNRAVRYYLHDYLRQIVLNSLQRPE
ncbi:ATP-binding protein [Spirulina sp. 06S082]|uniref:ATP-binding protein n=1 Tax=Spirulina sp. 06S082 TaxID=3110248 RepID=UPI002B1EF3D8|nr:ATP-binding protein [Spirulina sp. 06S082]MEA5468267.1 ATP-binding protein [Spirulina sp. 06S082]